MTKLEYYDTGSSSWKELDFREVKHVRRYDNFQYLEATLPNREKDKIQANMEIRWSTEGTQYFSGITQNSGEIRTDGKVNIKVFGHLYFVMGKETTSTIQSGLSNVTNYDVVDEMITNLDDSNLQVTYDLYNLSNYSTTPTTYDISSYKLTASNKQLIDEMTNDFAWTLYTQSDGTFYYEPIGATDAGSSADIDLSSDNNTVEEIEKDKIDDIVSKVKVIAKDSDGKKIDRTRTLSDIGETADFGVENFKRIRSDYATTTNELDDIGDRNLQSNAETKLKVKTLWFQTNLVNETLQVSDSNDIYGIGTDDYLVEKQVNFYPERSTILTLSTIRDRFEKTTFTHDQHRKEIDRRKGRASQITSSSTNIGGQNLTGNTDTAEADINDPGHAGHGVDNSTDGDKADIDDPGHSGHGVGGSTDGTTLDAFAGIQSWSSGVQPCNEQVAKVHLEDEIIGSSTYETTQVLCMVVNDTGSTQDVSPTIITPSLSTIGTTILNLSDGETAYHHSGESDSGNISGTAKFYDQDGNGTREYGMIHNLQSHQHGSSHSHADGTLDTNSDTTGVSDNGHGHASGTLDTGSDSTGVSDNGHGSDTDLTTHLLDGSTDDFFEKLAEEVKDDR